MAEPYVANFQLPDGTTFGSIIIDRPDFDAFIDELEALHLHGVTKESFDKIRERGHMPLMTRGTKTERFFQRWGITVDHMGVIVRGSSQNALSKLFDI